MIALSLALGLLGSDPSVNAGQWKDYVWKVAPVEACIARGCPPVVLKWDWKRPQTVELTIAPGRRGLVVTNRLVNNDPKDDDDVCVTLLMRDKGGRTIGVFHENRHSDARTDTKTTSEVRLAKGVLGSIRSVALGTKQCRKGPGQDDGVYRRMKAAIGQP